MKQSSKRFLSMVVSLALIVGAFIVLFEFVEPAYTGLQELKGTQLSTENLISEESSTVQEIGDIASKYGNENSQLAQLSVALPSSPDVADALAQVYGIAANNNILVASISISQPALMTAPTSNVPVKPAGRFTLALSSSGTYEDLKNFLTEIEENLRILDVTSLSISPLQQNGNSKGDMYQISVTIATYYESQ